MLYFLRKIKADNLLPEFPDFDVYVDSPLAVQATNIFKEHYVDCYDEEAMELLNQGINPIAFPGLKLRLQVMNLVPLTLMSIIKSFFLQVVCVMPVESNII